VSIIFSENIKAINGQAFWSCSKLEKVEIPKSVEAIEDYAFGDCEKATIKSQRVNLCILEKKLLKIVRM